MNPRLRIPLNLRYALTVVLLLLGLNFVLRLAFLFYNTGQAYTVPLSEILISFLVGVRFDLATIFIFNGLILLIMTLPFSFACKPKTYKICNWLIILANLPMLVMNIIDMVYYGYAEKRLTHELFTTKNDYQTFQPGFLMEWWYLLLLAIVLVYLFYRVLNRLSRIHLRHLESRESGPGWQSWLGVAVLAIFMFTGIRGGVQRTPLWSGKAFVGSTIFAGNLALNSGFTVVSSLDFMRPDPLSLVDQGEARKIIRQMVHNTFDGPFTSEEFPFLRKASFQGPERRYNVVFLVIESLNAANVGCIAGEAAGKSLTPNLDSLAGHGRLFRRFYANGTRSVESIPALLNSMPEVFARPTIGSRFINNRHYGLGNMLEERDYTSGFFCGGHNGTMSFDKYSPICGIDQYYGMDEYPHGMRDFDGMWGSYDWPILQWMAEMQNRFEKPFMSVFFSISNHHPFILPPDHTEDIAPLQLTDMEKTVMYTDRALAAYFKTVSQYAWYDSTVFVITGDHCFHADVQEDRPVMNNFHVPLLIMGPGISPGVDDRVSSHISLLPTLIEVLKLDTWHSSSAISLLDSTKTPYVINNLMGVTTLAHGDYALSTNLERTLAGYEMHNGMWEKVSSETTRNGPEWRDMDLKLRSLYQELFNARVADRFQVNGDFEARKAN
jgi:phosphoglycerol transferase MdoB-like AlkP superfamily enzyme